MPPSLQEAAREKQKADERLLEKLSSVRPSVDTKAPATYAHLAPGSGKAATLANARQKGIDEGNALLLRKLTRIATGGPSFDCGDGASSPAARPATGSLNSVMKRQEQERIDRENSRLLCSIIGDTGRLREFSPSALAAHYEQHQALLSRLSRYPPPR